MEIRTHILADVDFSSEAELESGEQTIWTKINDAQGFCNYDDETPNSALFNTEKDFDGIVDEDFIGEWRRVYGLNTCDDELSDDQRDELEKSCDFTYCDANYTFYLWRDENDAKQAITAVTTRPETFYGNENETFYVDQFGRVWLVQSVDFSEARDAELTAELPDGLPEVQFSDCDLSENVFELPEYAKAEVVTQAKKDAELFVDEFNEQLNPAATDWDAEGFQNCTFSFHTDDCKTHDEAWELYQETLVEETGRLAA